MTPEQRAALRAQWLQDIEVEISRRQATRETVEDDPRERLLAQLAEMDERVRADPNWRERTEAEQEADRIQVEAWIRTMTG